MSKIQRKASEKRTGKMSFLSQKMQKNMKKWQKNSFINPFALYMPKIMGFGQKTKKRYHNCPTQQYMTGPLCFDSWENIKLGKIVFVIETWSTID